MSSSLVTPSVKSRPESNDEPHECKSNNNNNVNSKMDVLYQRSGQALSNRAETVELVYALMGKSSPSPLPPTTTTSQDDGATTADAAPAHTIISPPRPPHTNVFGSGPLLLSDIPESCRTTSTTRQGVIVGIDEAGRGSVLGPMVYGMAYWNADVGKDKIPRDFNDSKQLTDTKRRQLMESILHRTPDLGFGIRVLHASEISRNMLRDPDPYNLNAMSHDAAIQLIRSLVNNGGVTIDTCYIDTVGNPESYKRRLQMEFGNIDFVVESKADANYAPCSAASVVAKVVRDNILEHWSFSEPHFREQQQAKEPTNNNHPTTSTNTTTNVTELTHSSKFGSGYPSDPVCKKWMEDHLHCKVFGFPDVVRFSWAPTKKTLEANGVAIKFKADEDEDESVANGEFALQRKRQQQQMSLFLGGGAGKQHKRRRYPYFEKRGLEIVSSLR